MFENNNKTTIIMRPCRSRTMPETDRTCYIRTNELYLASCQLFDDEYAYLNDISYAPAGLYDTRALLVAVVSRWIYFFRTKPYMMMMMMMISIRCEGKSFVNRIILGSRVRGGGEYRRK